LFEFASTLGLSRSVFWLLFLIPLVCQKRAEDYSNGFLMVFVFNFKSSSCWSIFLRPVFFFAPTRDAEILAAFPGNAKVLCFKFCQRELFRRPQFSIVVLVCVRRNPCAHSLYTTLHNHLKCYTQALVRAIITLLIKSLARDN
jgi:hypothetical protein